MFPLLLYPATAFVKLVFVPWMFQQRSHLAPDGNTVWEHFGYLFLQMVIKLLIFQFFLIHFGTLYLCSSLSILSTFSNKLGLPI